MEQQLDLDMPKKCQMAQENLESIAKDSLAAIEVLKEEAKYTGSEKTIQAVNALAAHIEGNIIPSYKETAEFYGNTGEELQSLFSVLN